MHLFPRHSGWRGRSQVSARLIASWLAAYQQEASATGPPSLTAQDLVGRFSFLLHNTYTTATALTTDPPLYAGRVVPPILMAYRIPTAQPSSPHNPVFVSRPLFALRGCFSIILRSMGTGVAPPNDYRSTVPAHQGIRVVWACCSVLGERSAAGDALLQLAAVQCLKKLTDSTAWLQLDDGTVPRRNVLNALVFAATSTGAAARAAARLLSNTQSGASDTTPHAKVQRRLQMGAVEVAMLRSGDVDHTHESGQFDNVDRRVGRRDIDYPPQHVMSPWVHLVQLVISSPVLAASGLVATIAFDQQAFANLLAAVPHAAEAMSPSCLLWCFANITVIAARCGL